MTFKNSQDSDWYTEEHEINSSTELPYGVIELNDPLKEKINEEKEHLNQALKQQLVEFFSDCFTSTLSPEDIIDCLRSSCSSSLDYAKSEYEKYLFIAKQLGIE
jgi:cytoplasmic iron level regulating protein YaaA (DUF328/UPF0246 family)